MSLKITTNKSKQFSFRINPKNSGIEFTLVIPGITISIVLKGLRNSKSAKGRSSQANSLHSPMQKIACADIESFQPERYQSLRRNISLLIKLNTFSNWIIPCIILPALLLAMHFLYRGKLPTIFLLFTFIFALIGTVGILLKIYVHTMGRIPIDYDTSVCDSENALAPNETSKWMKLLQAQVLWQITGIYHLQEADQKENAGSPFLYERIRITAQYKKPFYLKTKAKVIQLKLDPFTLILLADKCLVVRKSKVGLLQRNEIILSEETIAYPEIEEIPGDTKVLQYTWKYVNNDGSPDKRYKDNVKLPICSYRKITIRSESGLNIILLISRS